MPIAMPAGLPLPLVDGHSRSDEALYADVPMGRGVPRRRRLRRRAPQTATLSWRLTWAQLVVWEAWYEDELRAGAREFECPVKGRGDATTVETLIGRFVEPPQYTQASGLTTVSATVVAGTQSDGEVGFFEPDGQLGRPPERWWWTGPYVNSTEFYRTLDEAAAAWIALTNAAFGPDDSLLRSVALVSVTRSADNTIAVLRYDIRRNLVYWFTDEWNLNNSLP